MSPVNSRGRDSESDTLSQWKGGGEDERKGMGHSVLDFLNSNLPVLKKSGGRSGKSRGGPTVGVTG